MSVFCVEKTKNYTVMSNHHLGDRALSLKAKGLLSQMLSLPESWDYTLRGLAAINKGLYLPGEKSKGQPVHRINQHWICVATNPTQRASAPCNPPHT